MKKQARQVAPCELIQDNSGFHAVDSGFQVLDSGLLSFEGFRDLGIRDFRILAKICQILESALPYIRRDKNIHY